MKNKDLLIFAIIGFGIYWFLKKKSAAVVVPQPQTNNNVAPDTSLVMPTVNEADVNISYRINGVRKFGNVPNTI